MSKRVKCFAETVAALSWAAFLILFASAYAIDLGKAVLGPAGPKEISRPTAKP